MKKFLSEFFLNAKEKYYKKFKTYKNFENIQKL